MNKLTKIEQRQFVDEIFFLNKDKDFSGTFVDALKGGITFKNVEEILNDKRKAYDFALSNLFRKYGILPDSLYDTLDEFFDKESLSDFIKNYINTKYAVVGVAGWGFSNIILSVIVSGLLSSLPIVALGVLQYAVKIKWDDYKIEVLQYADKYSLELVKDAD